ncbi:MAG: pitrilysin family protein [Gemmatimonadota bacterium]
MKHTIWFLLATALAAGCASTATVPAEPYPTAPPSLGPAPSFEMADPIERTLSNGLTVLYLSRGELPLVQAVLVTRAGAMDDPADLTGLAAFTADMLDEGAGGRDALELAAAIEQLGATLGVGAGWDASQISLQVLRDELPEALAIMADVVMRPDFPEAELTRVRDERLTELASARDDAATIAGNAFASLVYGSDHPYGRLSTQESARRFDRQTLRDFHSRYYRPGTSTLVLVGAIDSSMHPQVERIFGNWPATGSVTTSSVPAPPETASTRIFLVDKPGAAQSEIRIGHPGVARDTPDYYALQVLNTLLGGSFTSRLNQNLRETHGYTYGAGSGFGMRLGEGPFSASAAVVTAKTDSSVIEFFRELNRIRDEVVPADELERAKQYVALRLPQQMETTGQVAARLADLVTYDLPLDYYGDYVQRVMAVTAADVQRVARRYVRPGRSVVVVVGDRQQIEPGLRALPIGTVEIRDVEEFVR